MYNPSVIIPTDTSFFPVFYPDRSSEICFLTSESVSHGHPDKVADRIADEVLDYCISKNPEAHVAVDALVTVGRVVIAGEVYGVTVDSEAVDALVRGALRDIGYELEGFHWKTVSISVMIHEQSQDIIQGVNLRGTKGAGDQGIMYGYAINETESLMPSPIFYSHFVLRNLFSAIRNGKIRGLGPDAKTALTVKYEGRQPVALHKAVISIQHDESMTQRDVREIVYPYLIEAIPKGWMCSDEDFYVNPTGRFVVGGPVGDTGVTGRKIMVDTYGGHVPHGGGAFSGKDPSKVDRSAAYVARYLAKNIVHSGLASECLVQLSYSIGVPHPLTFSVKTFGTGVVDHKKIEKFISEAVDLSVSGICSRLTLLKQLYSPTSCYGHFGRAHSRSFSWENLDLSLCLSREFNPSNHVEMHCNATS